MGLDLVDKIYVLLKEGVYSELLTNYDDKATEFF